MAVPRIEDYGFGRMVVDGEKHTSDLILLPDRVVSDWWREAGHRLVSEDLTAVFDAGPDLLVVGTGAYGRMKVTDEARRALEEAGIEVEVGPTKRAIEVYNEMCQQREVAGAFHLTC